MPPITRALININVAIFVLQLFAPDALMAKFALWPIGSFARPDLGAVVGFEIWQIISSAFLHGGLMHLVLNMFVLFMFGSEVEGALGQTRFLELYFIAVVAAAVTQLVVVTASIDEGVHPTVGASGGVFGVLLAFGLLFPRRTVVLLIPPIPMPAIVFVFIIGGIEIFLGVTGSASGIAHFAHLGGMLGGFLAVRRWRKPRRRGGFR